MLVVSAYARRGKSAALDRVMKPLFYLYYPLHLFLIGLIRTFFLS